MLVVWQIGIVFIVSVYIYIYIFRTSRQDSRQEFGQSVKKTEMVSTVTFPIFIVIGFCWSLMHLTCFCRGRLLGQGECGTHEECPRRGTEGPFLVNVS